MEKTEKTPTSILYESLETLFNKEIRKPTQALTKILEEELKETYKTCESAFKNIEVWTLDENLLGESFLISKDEKRNISIELKGLWEKTEITEVAKQFHQYLKISIVDNDCAIFDIYLIQMKQLDNLEFIQAIRDFLTGEKKNWNIPWKKWKIKR
jgi:hypothetical protein